MRASLVGLSPYRVEAVPPSVVSIMLKNGLAQVWYQKTCTEWHVSVRGEICLQNIWVKIYIRSLLAVWFTVLFSTSSRHNRYGWLKHWALVINSTFSPSVVVWMTMSQAVHTLYFQLEIKDMSSQLLPQLSGLSAATLPTRDGDGLLALWNRKLG